jgi:hypothetical protein
MRPIDIITQDLDWREREIAAMRLLISRPGLTNSQRAALLRAGWAMLYAHYEGFIKNTLTVFYDEASKTAGKCEHLPSSTKVFALRDALRSLRNLPYDDMLNKIEKFQIDHLSSNPNFPDVDTKSNLWPDVLIDLYKTADLDTSIAEKNEAKLRTLVSRRNSIAHGEKSFINEISYFRGFEEAVYEVLYDVALQVDYRLSQPPYLAQQG